MQQRDIGHRMGERLYDVIKSGLMIKRSQNKNRFTLINYKTRWFELTRQSLSYFDIENYEVSLSHPLLLDGQEMQDIPHESPSPLTYY